MLAMLGLRQLACEICFKPFEGPLVNLHYVTLRKKWVAQLIPLATLRENHRGTCAACSGNRCPLERSPELRHSSYLPDESSNSASPFQADREHRLRQLWAPSRKWASKRFDFQMRPPARARPAFGRASWARLDHCQCERKRYRGRGSRRQ